MAELDTDALKQAAERAKERTDNRSTYCYTCIFWERKDEDGNDFAKQPGDHARARGCHWLPTVTYKAPDDWCGQHKSA